jgi:hypothetical protein
LSTRRGWWFGLVLGGCEPTIDYAQIEQGCTETGGTLTTDRCCPGTRDYPLTCDDDPCDCSGETDTVLYCLCGATACWNGVACSIE